MSQLLYWPKQAWSGLCKKPGFVAAVVTTMGTTVGALLCILTLAYLLILQPLPYPDQSRLSMVQSWFKNGDGTVDAEAFTYPGVIHLYKTQQQFDEGAMVLYSEEVLTSLPSQPRRFASFVTPEWFPLLGAKMARGRMFEQTEALDTNNPVAVLTYESWQRDFGADEQILERKVTLMGVSFRIVGVLAPDFVEPQINHAGAHTDIWLPWDFNPETRIRNSWTNITGAIKYLGLQKSAVETPAAAQTLTALINGQWREKVEGDAFFQDWSIRAKVIPLQQVILGDSASTVYLLIVGILGLVLIACANIANLFMSRTAEQQKQLAIYAALGAKKSHLFRTLLAESGLLMVISMLFALAVASAGFYVLQLFLNETLPRVDELSINGVTLMAAVFIALLLAVFFAWLSSKMIDYRALNTSLQSSGKGTGVQVSKRFRQFLVASQVTIATLLIFSNLTLFRQALDSIHQPTGFKVDNLYHLVLSVSGAGRPEAAEIEPVVKQIKQELSNLPEVELVSQSGSVLGRFGLWALTEVSRGENFTPRAKGVSDAYFQLVGQPLIEGDYFSAEDMRESNRVMIVNRAFAERLNPGGSAVGMELSPGPDEVFRIVGVVENVRMPGSEEVPMRVYAPSRLAETQLTYKVVSGQTVSRQTVIDLIKAVDPRYSIFYLESLEERYHERLFAQYTTAVTTVVLTCLTLFLASIGLYGILSYGTHMRRFELGTRMAIGAKGRDLTWMILRENFRVILAGVGMSVVIGLGLYVLFRLELAQYINLMLPALFALTLLFITLLSAFACYWPLRRYIRYPAIHALRGHD